MSKRINVNDVSAERDVIMGDQVNITYVLKMPAYEPPADLARLRTDYLAHLRRTYRALDFKGIPQLETFSRELLLEDVYVPLVARPEMPAGETWERRLAGRRLGQDTLPEEVMAAMDAGKGSAVPVRVEEAMAEKTRVAVIGDPGSGNTTPLKHLALRLAALARLLVLPAAMACLPALQVDTAVRLVHRLAPRTECRLPLHPARRESQAPTSG